MSLSINELNSLILQRLSDFTVKQSKYALIKNCTQKNEERIKSKALVRNKLENMKQTKKRLTFLFLGAWSLQDAHSPTRIKPCPLCRRSE